MLYVTPHRWTPFFRLAIHRRVIQTDQSRWDYKHQVLATRHMAPWRLLLWVKFIEAVLQLRPKALLRVLAHRDSKLRHGMRWYTRMGRRVWPHEMFGFLFRDRRVANGPSLSDFWGPPQDSEEEAMMSRQRERSIASLNRDAA
jgi:anaerobic magnesium-protoporphyrin IX monomethyl ester cyclase